MKRRRDTVYELIIEMYVIIEYVKKIEGISSGTKTTSETVFKQGK